MVLHYITNYAADTCRLQINNRVYYVPYTQAQGLASMWGGIITSANNHINTSASA